MDNLYLDNYQLNTELDDFNTSAQLIEEISNLSKLGIRGTVAIELIQKQQDEIIFLSNAFKTHVLSNISPQLGAAVSNINNTDYTAALQLTDYTFGYKIYNELK